MRRRGRQIERVEKDNVEEAYSYVDRQRGRQR